MLVEFVKIRRQNRNKKVGMLIGYLDSEGVLKIGFSQCNARDEFDPAMGFVIALGRSETITDRWGDDLDDFVDAIPIHVAKALPAFINRCRRYFKDASDIDRWILFFQRIVPYNMVVNG